jgi:hypothetical protein
MRKTGSPPICRPTHKLSLQRRSWQNLWLQEDGGTLVEIAFVLPIALLFTFGAILLCVFMYGYNSATYGGRAAIRYAEFHGAASITPCTAANLSTIVSGYLTGIPASAVTVTSTWSPNHSPGSSITIKVALAYVTGVPIAGLSTLSVSTTATGTVVQ